ncbi:MAG: hypothetical protein ACKO7W_05885 [Elainella sp.]
MAILLFTMIVALGLFVVQALIITPAELLFSLHLPANVLLVGGLLVVAWLLAD